MAMRRYCTIFLPLAALAMAASAFADRASDSSLNDRAVQAYNAGDFETAALLFHDLAESGTTDELRLKAEHYLAQSFLKRGLFNAALRQYAYVIKAGPNHPHYLRAVEGVVEVSELLHEDFITGAILDKEYNDEFTKLPIEVINKVNYIVGLVSYRKNKREEALGFLAAVPADSSYYGRARYLTGVIQARKGEGEKAAQAFEEVAKLASTPRLTYVDLQGLHELAALGLARSYYGMGRYAEAVKSYESVPRFSEYWDEALFENGWARFLNDDYGGALGSLQALHAPQFAGSFQPESWILKATVYYHSCLYDDAKRALEGFEKVYLPINEVLKPLLAEDKDNDFYHALLAEGSDKLPRSVKNYLLANRRLVQLKAYADELIREKKIIEGSQVWRDSKLQADLSGAIEPSRELAMQMTGSFVKKRLEDASKTIIGFDGQKEIIKLEVAKAEADLLEAHVDQAKLLSEKEIWRPATPASSREYWQFQGEFWLDEIGYYQYTLKSGCIQKEE
jgi:hypothetical protein